MKDLDGMEKARDQVDEVTDMMRGNMTKIMERDGKLEDLEMKADQLHVDSQQFQVIFCKRKTSFNLTLSFSENHSESKKKSNAGKHEDEDCYCRSCLPCYCSHNYHYCNLVIERNHYCNLVYL